MRWCGDNSAQEEYAMKRDLHVVWVEQSVLRLCVSHLSAYLSKTIIYQTVMFDIYRYLAGMIVHLAAV